MANWAADWLERNPDLAGFFAVGSFYWVVVSTITIDSQTVTFVPATFRIVAAEGTAGYPKSDAQYVGGTTQTGRDLGATLGVAGAGLTAVPWNTPSAMVLP